MIPLALQQVQDPIFFDFTSSAPQIVTGWLVCFFTLSVFSFLYRDNPFYKIAEHVFIGAGTAWFALQYYAEGILDPVVYYIRNAIGMSPGELVQLGAYDLTPTWAIFWRALAAILGLFLLVRLFAPNSWAPRWPLAIMVGIYAALKMTGETQSKLVIQVRDAAKPLVDPTRAAWSDNWVKIEETQVFYTVANVILLGGLICALGHFIFTYKRTRLLAGVSRVGIVVLMITFGSMFGFTVLGRIALLIERVNNLATYNEPEYALADTTLGQATLLSPPILIAFLMGLLLIIGAIRRRGQDTETTL